MTLQTEDLQKDLLLSGYVDVKQSADTQLVGSCLDSA
jgi:hypothetical protein